VRIAVSKAAAYDLYLTRSLKAAELARSDDPVESFLRDKIDVLAGVKQGIVAFAADHPGMRILPGRFMEIQQAMCMPKGRAAGAGYLRSFVEDMKKSGFVAEAIKRAGQEATVAGAG
jgi:polar amino acid transport system substrate-binding protein